MSKNKITSTEIINIIERFKSNIDMWYKDIINVPYHMRALYPRGHFPDHNASNCRSLLKQQNGNVFNCCCCLNRTREPYYCELFERAVKCTRSAQGGKMPERLRYCMQMHDILLELSLQYFPIWTYTNIRKERGEVYI